MAVVAPQGNDFSLLGESAGCWTDKETESGAGGAVTVRRSSTQNPDDETTAGGAGRVVVISMG
jgi:hypothetical protein